MSPVPHFSLTLPLHLHYQTSYSHEDVWRHEIQVQMQPRCTEYSAKPTPHYRHTKSNVQQPFRPSHPISCELQRWLYIRIRAWNRRLLSTVCRGLWIEIFIRQCNFLAVKVVFDFEQKASRSWRVLIHHLHQQLHVHWSLIRKNRALRAASKD